MGRIIVLLMNRNCENRRIVSKDGSGAIPVMHSVSTTITFFTVPSACSFRIANATIVDRAESFSMTRMWHDGILH